MRKYLRPGFLGFLVLSGLIFSTCAKQERYDLFPLKVGNEFYYKYYKYRYIGVSSYTNGTVTWKVVSESSQENNIKYTIEVKMDATVVGIGAKIISDSIRYVEISEDKSSSLISASSLIPLWNFPFKRYQDVSHAEVKQECLSGISGWSFIFKADSGLTKYAYCHPPNQITNESLTLDSLKLLQ
jgi:hypothetical protein